MPLRMADIDPRTAELVRFVSARAQMSSPTFAGAMLRIGATKWEGEYPWIRAHMLAWDCAQAEIRVDRERVKTTLDTTEMDEIPF